MLPLEDIVILDFSRLLPGPYCSMMLADLGCDVIKIEEPGTGDYARWMPPFIKGESARFLSVNRNKKSMTLNLKTEKGKNIFFKLVEKADVVLESFRPGIVKKLGIDYEQVKLVNPKIIYCSVTAYGQTGVNKKKAAHDINIIGMGGVLSITKEMSIPGVQIADTTGGLLACIGILSAVIAREKTGKGQYIDISMLDGVVSLLSVHAGKYFATGENMGPDTMILSGGVACYNVYETKDKKHVTLGALEPKFWKEFCTYVNRADLISSQYQKDQRTLTLIVQEIFKERPQKEWIDEIPVCAPVHSLPEVFTEKQVVHRNMVLPIQHPVGEIQQLGIPVKLSDTPGKIRNPPPLFGEHTEEILKDLGYSEEEIHALRVENVI
jgi:crotonobetainyl-CoA:carnitine CoA-transferase CaiB-like acyl-CoA transferase